MVMNRRRWRQDQLIRKAQSLILVALMAALLGGLAWLLGGVALGLGTVLGVVLVYWINPMSNPMLMTKLYRASPLYHGQAPGLYRLLEALARRAGLSRLPRLYLIPGGGLNAFAAGNRKAAVIALSQNLINRLTPDELEGILAHEVSHIRNNDTRLMGFAELIGRMTRMLSLFGQAGLLISLPLVIAGAVAIHWIAIWLLILAPAISLFLFMALSRTREYRADLDAAALTGNPRALARALAKIENTNRSLMARLFWRAGGANGTHPPTEERIAKLLGLMEAGPQRPDQPINGSNRFVLRTPRMAPSGYIHI